MPGDPPELLLLLVELDAPLLPVVPLDVDAPPVLLVLVLLDVPLDDPPEVPLDPLVE